MKARQNWREARQKLIVHRVKKQDAIVERDTRARKRTADEMCDGKGNGEIAMK